MRTSIAKKITSAVMAAATVMTIAAAAPMASAATYYFQDGTVYNDGINDGKMFQEDRYGVFQEQVYIGYDAFYGNIYYGTDDGYYSLNGDTIEFLGWDFTITRYIGRDYYNRKIYFNENIGYFYIKGDNYYNVEYDSIRSFR